METDDSILVDVADGVATVTINNPRRRNALTPESSDRLVDTLLNVDADPTVGALVIRGAQGSFCSGADLSSLGGAMEDPAGEVSYRALERIYRAFTIVGELGIPTIAAVRGAAVGAGVNLMMATDVRIVASNARLLSGFSRLGLHPGGGHLQLVAKAARTEAAVVMGLLGEEIDGRRAAEIGLAWEATEDAQVEERALSLAHAAGADPELARRIIHTLRVTMPTQVPWATALLAERAPQLWSLRRAGVRRAEEIASTGED
jgi:enoyl-CoA hydratase